MDIRKYQIEATRTMLDTGDRLKNINHCIIGMFSEFNELVEAVVKKDTVNIGEEIGDKLFYLANYFTFRGFDLYSLKNALIIPKDSKILFDTGAVLMDMSFKLSKIQNIIKGVIYYGRDFSHYQDELTLLGEYASCIAVIAHVFQLDIEVIMGKNINKLRVRYPEKFNTSNANERDLSQELEQLK